MEEEEEIEKEWVMEEEEEGEEMAKKGVAEEDEIEKEGKEVGGRGGG